jgi:hypothetical protein
MDHMGDHVVAAAEHCDATGRPQNGDQKDWHTEPPLLLLSWLDNAVSNLAFLSIVALAREDANATGRN